MNPAALFGSDIPADDAVEDPLWLLGRWLSRVEDVAPGTVDAQTVPLMALATVDADGYPRARHVLLSAYDRGGLHFHTDTRTAKASELAAHPRAGVTIVWPEIPRQLTITGEVLAETAPEQALAFARRTRYLQVLAWVNDERLARRPLADRARVWAEFDATHPTLDPPPTWIGYALVPERITFWRGGPDGPSQRLACRRTAGGWSTERLPG